MLPPPAASNTVITLLIRALKISCRCDGTRYDPSETNQQNNQALKAPVVCILFFKHDIGPASRPQSVMNMDTLVVAYIKMKIKINVLIPQWGKFIATVAQKNSDIEKKHLRHNLNHISWQQSFSMIRHQIHQRLFMIMVICDFYNFTKPGRSLKTTPNRPHHPHHTLSMVGGGASVFRSRERGWFLHNFEA